MVISGVVIIDVGVGGWDAIDVEGVGEGGGILLALFGWVVV